MQTIVVCVGSSCYVRGSEKMAETFERLIHARGLNGRVELTGAFCMEQCSMGVSVRVGDKVFRCLDAANAESFFEQQVMPMMQVVAYATPAGG
jgi:NADH:ubiquinone oxidoreductase subunit E